MYHRVCLQYLGISLSEFLEFLNQVGTADRLIGRHRVHTYLLGIQHSSALLNCNTFQQWSRLANKRDNSKLAVTSALYRLLSLVQMGYYSCAFGGGQHVVKIEAVLSERGTSVSCKEVGYHLS